MREDYRGGVSGVDRVRGIGRRKTEIGKQTPRTCAINRVPGTSSPFLVFPVDIKCSFKQVVREHQQFNNSKVGILMTAWLLVFPITRFKE